MWDFYLQDERIFLQKWRKVWSALDFHLRQSLQSRANADQFPAGLLETCWAFLLEKDLKVSIFSKQKLEYFTILETNCHII